MNSAFLVGRIIVSLYFLQGGYGHLAHTKMLVDYTRSKKIPSPKLAVIVTGLMLVLGGLSILLGYHTNAGLSLLLVFLIPTTFLMHQFWKISDPMQKMGDQINFMKNMALVGMILMMFALPVPWPAFF